MLRVVSDAKCQQSDSAQNLCAQKDRVLEKDLAAYKRLRDDGVQPKNIDGSATVEARANEKWQVETGILPDF